MLPEHGLPGSLKGVGVGVVQGLGWRAGLGDLPTPLVLLYSGVILQYPAFALGTLEVAVGFLVFLYLVVQNLFQLLMYTVIF